MVEGEQERKGEERAQGGEKGIEQNWAVTGGSTISAASKTTQSPAQMGASIEQELVFKR